MLLWADILISSRSLGVCAGTAEDSLGRASSVCRRRDSASSSALASAATPTFSVLALVVSLLQVLVLAVSAVAAAVAVAVTCVAVSEHCEGGRFAWGARSPSLVLVLVSFVLLLVSMDSY